MKPLGGQPPQQEIDINDTETVVCDECGKCYIHSMFLPKKNITNRITNRTSHSIAMVPIQVYIVVVIVVKFQISLCQAMTVKKKSLFDHVNQVTSVQNPNYWDEISDEDKKSWSNYMINRFLSMKSEWTDLVNEVQKYPLEPKELYKVYTSILPKKKQWLRYIKGDKKMKYPIWVYEIVSKHLQCSMREANDAVEMYRISAGGQSELADIMFKYGVEDKEVRKLGLI